jgi:integrase
MGYGSRIAQPRPDRTPNTAAETVTHSLVIAPRGHHCADRRLPALNDRIAGRWPLRHCRSHRQAFYTSHLAEEWTPRELRHSFVSLLSSAGIPIEDIAHLVGHANTRTTEKVYRKELRPVLRRGAKAMDDLFKAHHEQSSEPPTLPPASSENQPER